MKIYKSIKNKNVLYRESNTKKFYGSGYAEVYNKRKGNVISINRDKSNIRIETSSHSDINGIIKELKDKFGLIGSEDDYFYNVDEYYDISLDGYADYKGQRAFVSLGLYFENSDDSLTVDDAERMNDLEIVDSNIDMSNHFDRW